MIRPEWPAPANVVAGTSLIDTPDGALPDGLNKRSNHDRI